MITEIPGCEAIDSTLNGNPTFEVFELIKPPLVRIFARWREIVTNFHAKEF
jgi:hypothetical protein